MELKNIFVLGGGYSPEWEVSVKSANFVYGELRKEFTNAYLIMINREGWFMVRDNGDKYDIDKNDFSFTVDGKKITPEVVVNVIHGTPGENGMLQGYLEILGIPQVGCSTLSSAITFDKEVCKRMVESTGVSMAREITLSDGETIDPDRVVEGLGLPVFIKPSNSGSSFGVTKVKDKKDMADAINHARTEGGVVMIEEAIVGREVACGIYITSRGEHFLPVTEIISENEYFDYEAKYEGASNEVTPADLSCEVVEKLRKYTIEIYKRLRCTGTVRVDYIIQDDEPYFIELNSVPGMSAQSIVPQQLNAAGVTVCEMVKDILSDKLN